MAKTENQPDEIKTLENEVNRLNLELLNLELKTKKAINKREELILKVINK